jgi:hypothetical protein
MVDVISHDWEQVRQPIRDLAERICQARYSLREVLEASPLERRV